MKNNTQDIKVLAQGMIDRNESQLPLDQTVTFLRTFKGVFGLNTRQLKSKVKLGGIKL